MQKLRDRLRTAPRLAFTLVTLALLAVSATPPLVSAEDTEDYTAAEIESWLVDKISTTAMTVTASPVVELTPASHLMRVTAFSFELRGIPVGLSELRITANGTTTVDVVGELDVLGKLPRFSCDLQMECTTATGKLHVASVSNIVIADDFSPSLDAGDLDTIKNVLNDIIDSSGLSVTSPGGDLTGIDVVDEGSGARLKTTWTAGGPSYLTAGEIETKLDGMADTLAGKGTDYLAAGEGDWNVDIVVNPDKSALEVDASLSAFGVTSALSDFNITFDTLTAAVAVATCSIGTSTKTFTFSLEGEVGCDALVPSLSMTSLSVGDEYAGFQGFIADVEAALLDAIEQAVDAIVEDTGLEFPFCPTSITVEGETVVLHRGAALMEGDATLDGTTNIVDAMVIAQYTVQLREFTADQLTAGDTTDDGQTNITDAMHIAQFTVDPTGVGGVLYKPLWQSPADVGMINPLTP